MVYGENMKDLKRASFNFKTVCFEPFNHLFGIFFCAILVSYIALISFASCGFLVNLDEALSTFKGFLPTSCCNRSKLLDILKHK